MDHVEEGYDGDLIPPSPEVDSDALPDTPTFPYHSPPSPPTAVQVSEEIVDEGTVIPLVDTGKMTEEVDELEKAIIASAKARERKVLFLDSETNAGAKGLMAKSSVVTSKKNPEWVESVYLDTGATEHMSPYKRHFDKSSFKLLRGQYLELAADTKEGTPIVGVGSYDLYLPDGTKQRLTKVLYVPTLKSMLVSIGALIDASIAACCVFTKTAVFVQRPPKVELEYWGERSHSLYEVKRREDPENSPFTMQIKAMARVGRIVTKKQPKDAKSKVRFDIDQSQNDLIPFSQQKEGLSRMLEDATATASSSGEGSRKKPRTNRRETGEDHMDLDTTSVGSTVRTPVDGMRDLSMDERPSSKVRSYFISPRVKRQHALTALHPFIPRNLGGGERVSMHRWHLRFGHVGRKVIETMRRELVNPVPYPFRKQNLNKIIETESDSSEESMSEEETDMSDIRAYYINKQMKLSYKGFKCVVCDLGKITKTPIYLSPRSQAERVVERWHTDLSGPIPVRSFGMKYFQVVMDEYSRYIFVHFMSKKTDAAAMLMNCIDREEVRHNQPALYIRLDQGSELKTGRFDEWTKEKTPEITVEWTVRRVKELGGIHERSMRTLAQIATCMLIQSHLPKKMWMYAIKHAAYLYNRLYHKSVGKTPYEVWTGRKPDVRHLRVFGCLVILYTEKEDRTKFSPKGQPAVFVGYDGNRILLAYNLRTQRVERHYFARFHEDRFPGLSLRSANDLYDEDADESASEGITADFLLLGPRKWRKSFLEAQERDAQESDEESEEEEGEPTRERWLEESYDTDEPAELFSGSEDGYGSDDDGSC
jgi:hypothetical protein